MKADGKAVEVKKDFVRDGHIDLMLNRIQHINEYRNYFEAQSMGQFGGWNWSYWARTLDGVRNGLWTGSKDDVLNLMAEYNPQELRTFFEFMWLYSKETDYGFIRIAEDAKSLLSNDIDEEEYKGFIERFNDFEGVFYPELSSDLILLNDHLSLLEEGPDVRTRCFILGEAELVEEIRGHLENAKRRFELVKYFNENTMRAILARYGLIDTSYGLIKGMEGSEDKGSHKRKSTNIWDSDFQVRVVGDILFQQNKHKRWDDGRGCLAQPPIFHTPLPKAELDDALAACKRKNGNKQKISYLEGYLSANLAYFNPDASIGSGMQYKYISWENIRANEKADDFYDASILAGEYLKSCFDNSRPPQQEQLYYMLIEQVGQVANQYKGDILMKVKNELEQEVDFNEPGWMSRASDSLFKYFMMILAVDIGTSPYDSVAVEKIMKETSYKRTSKA